MQLLGRDGLLEALYAIGCDEAGRAIMEKKSKILGFKIKGLLFPAVMILKQEALVAGAELATPKECILGSQTHYDGILFGSLSSLMCVARKCTQQPFGLKKLALELKEHLQAHLPVLPQKPKIMAIVNITPDSFYASSRQSAKSAIERIKILLQKGVEIIDIGAASSRPGSDLMPPDVEMKRLDEVLAFINGQRGFEMADFSIDSYNQQVVQDALDAGFKIINDVSGISDPRMLELGASFDAQVVLMHTQGTPKEMMNLTNYKDVFASLDEFFENRLEACQRYGVKRAILDIGFGFAKTPQQNFALIKHLEHFKRFGLPILVGASRKSSLQKAIGKDANGALSATLSLHLLALQNQADILRVHDEEEHRDMIKIWEAYCNA